MGNIFIHVTMSLDGLIARPNDEIDWAFHYGTDHMVDEVVEEIGAVVLGRPQRRDHADQQASVWGHGEGASFCRHP